MRRSQWIAWVLVTTQAVPPVWAAIPPKIPARIGIVRVSGSSTTDARFSVLERRIQRWLEKDTDLEISAIPASAPGRGFFEEQLNRSRFERVLVAAKGQPFSEAIWDGLRVERENYGKYPGSGPLLQQSLIEEAKAAFRVGERETSRGLLSRAMRLHPDGTLETESEWEEEGELSSWERLRISVAGSLKGICELQIESSPEEAKLTVNGFPLGTRRAFHLSPGQSYHFELAATGRAPWSTDYQCTRQSSRRFTARLDPGPATGPSLAAVARAERVESVLLLGEESGRVKLFLYSPSGRLDEVPLTQPLRVAELADAGASASVPIATDAFLDLLQTHRLASLGLGSQIGEPVAESRLDGVRGPATRWYNDWKFWAAAGGVLAGVVVTVLVTRGNDVRSQGGMTIRLE